MAHDNDQYIGEVRLFAGDYVPEGWHRCDGTKLSVADYPELFKLIAFTYGGWGSEFKLPDLTGKVAVGMANPSIASKYRLGSIGGENSVELGENNLPAHSHRFRVSGYTADSDVASNTKMFGITSLPKGNSSWPVLAYLKGSAKGVAKLVALRNDTIWGGDNQTPHQNMMPSIALDYIIALIGAKPSPAAGAPT